MSHLICPLCGLSRPLASFDPTSFDRDICSQSFSGLGRGRGFLASGRVSILHSDTTKLIKGRLLDLVSLLMENGLLTRSELEGRLGLTDSDDETLAYKALLEEEHRKVNRLQEEADAITASSEETLRDQIREIGMIAQGQLSEIDSDLADRFGLAEDMEQLKEAIETLIDQFQACMASQEECS